MGEILRQSKPSITMKTKTTKYKPIEMKFAWQYVDIPAFLESVNRTDLIALLKERGIAVKKLKSKMIEDLDNWMNLNNVTVAISIK
jgi:hypothetical protein